MNRMTLAIAAITLAAGSAAALDNQKPAWKMSGELEESCSCDAACPCWFGSHPTKMTCGGGQVLFIDHGSYGTVSLDGLAFGEFVQSPEGKSMAESIGDWKFGYVYIDEKANPDQRQALERIAAQVFPPTPADRLKVRYVGIARTIEGTEHRVTVGQYGSFSAHLLAGGLSGAPKISNPPLADPIHKEFSQGITTKQAYHDAASWDFSNSNYMYTKFAVTSADYEKFAEAMAEKKPSTEK